MAAKDEITDRYTQARMAAAANDRRLTPAEFMLSSSPGVHKVEYRGATFYSKYSNADSASRAYRKVKSGETSGENMVKQGKLYTYKAPGVERGFIVGAPRGQYMMGLWKIVVHLNWTDQDGNGHYDEQRSFIVQTDKYDSYFDAQQVIQESSDAIDEHVAAWEDDYGVGDVEVVYVEALRIQTTSKAGAYIVTLDSE